MTNFTRMHNDYLDPDKNIPNWCDDWVEDNKDDNPDPIDFSGIPDCPDDEYLTPYEWYNDMLNDYF